MIQKWGNQRDKNFRHFPTKFVSQLHHKFQLTNFDQASSGSVRNRLIDIFFPQIELFWWKYRLRWNHRSHCRFHRYSFRSDLEINSNRLENDACLDLLKKPLNQFRGQKQETQDDARGEIHLNAIEFEHSTAPESTVVDLIINSYNFIRKLLLITTEFVDMSANFKNLFLFFQVRYLRLRRFLLLDSEFA